MGKLTVVFFVLALLIELLITAPASLLDWGLQYGSSGRMFLANASGTVWQGTATPALRTKDGRAITLPFLRWKIVAQSLLSGKIHAILQWDDQSNAAATEAIISAKKIELNHLQLQLPARVLEEASVMLKPAQFRGQLQIQSDHVEIQDRSMLGIVMVDWRQASSAISTIAPLGEYHLTLNGAADRINIGLTTTSGILVLEGEGNLPKGSGLEFHCRAHASTGNYDKLAELLHHIGPEVSPGVYGFNLTP
jgi:general secretion pathway protein N